MAFITIESSDIEVGDPISNSLMTQIKDNLDDLDSRISGVAASGQVDIFNELIEIRLDQLAGTIHPTMYTNDELNNYLGNDFIAPKGEGSANSFSDFFSSSKTFYEWGNKFLIQANSGDYNTRSSSKIGGYLSELTKLPSGGNVTGSITSGTFSGNVNSLSGSISSNGSHNHNIEYIRNEISGRGAAESNLRESTAEGASGPGWTSWDSDSYRMNNNGTHNHTFSFSSGLVSGSSVAGGISANVGWDSINRPKTGVCNYAMRKTGLDSSKNYLVYKANTNLVLQSAVATQLEVGTSGTLEFDVLSGSSLGSLSTVFTTKPSVGYAAGSNASSTNAVFGTTSITAGDWIVLRITNMQQGGTDGGRRFHVNLSAARSS